MLHQLMCGETKNNTKAMGINKEKFFAHCLKNIDEFMEQTGKSEEEAIIVLKKALDKMFE